MSLWARTLIGALQDAGVRDLVVSPGSRSTPILLAAAASKLELHIHIDERSAAFFALGHARATSAPTALLCTSGTAGAHYLPALLEAAHARIPLVAITADRPPELHGCGAPQTLDQSRLFAAAVRSFVDLGTAERSLAALRGLRRRVLQIVAESAAPDPGPVHLNVPLRKPLEPEPEDDDAAAQALTAALAAEPRPTRHAAVPRACGDALEELAAACREARRGILLLGPAPLEQGAEAEAIASLAAISGFPLCAEAASQLRFRKTGRAPRCDAFALLAASAGERADLRPDFVLQIGAAPTSAAWSEWACDAPRWVLSRHGWPDPESRARVIAGPVGDASRRLAARLGDRPREPAWAERLGAADALAWRVVDRLAPESDEGSRVRAAVAASGAGSYLFLGNSLPIRTVDAYCPGTLGERSVLSQRGANGIDGLISAAAGSATALGRPLTAIVGDVSFAHDLSGLAAVRKTHRRLRIVVIDNGGGRIFEQLPVVDLELGSLFERAWITPPAVDIGAASRAYGIRYRRCDDDAAVAAAVADPDPAPLVVHAPVAPSSAKDSRRRLERALAAELRNAAP